MIERPSPNHDARPAGGAIDMLVLHYTGMASAEAALARMCDGAAKVSAHYMVEEDGAVYRLVAEERRAWHAGASHWRGRDDVNAVSVGVEIVNPGHEFGYRPFPEAQMAALETLCRDILARHPIPARNVVGHSDVAPARKTDPGELFDWARLAAAGIGLWPEVNVATGEMGLALRQGDAGRAVAVRKGQLLISRHRDAMRLHLLSQAKEFARVKVNSDQGRLLSDKVAVIQDSPLKPGCQKTLARPFAGGLADPYP